MRNLEHLGASFGKQQRRQGGPKYTLWKALGIDGPLMMPVFDVDSSEADSVENLIISRDQPGANKRGRKLERMEQWRRRQETAELGPRAHRNRRPATTPREAVTRNFWSQPTLVWKAHHDCWREQPRKGACLLYTSPSPRG